MLSVIICIMFFLTSSCNYAKIIMMIAVKYWS